MSLTFDLERTCLMAQADDSPEVIAEAARVRAELGPWVDEDRADTADRTVWGVWAGSIRGGSSADTPRQWLRELSAEWATTFDIDAAARELVALINAVLEPRLGVTFDGVEFVGPRPRGELDIPQLLDAIDVWVLLERHALPFDEQQS